MHPKVAANVEDGNSPGDMDSSLGRLRCVSNISPSWKHPEHRCHGGSGEPGDDAGNGGANGGPDSTTNGSSDYPGPDEYSYAN